MNIQEKIKLNRTRPAEIQGEPVQVKVHSGKEWKKLLKKIDNASEKQMAKIISEQFFYEDGKPVFTEDFLLTGDIPSCVGPELMEVFIRVNSGVYGKKFDTLIG